YSGLAPQTLAPGQSQFRALEGTRLELDAEATKPLEAAELKIGDEPAGTAVAFDSSRIRFKASIAVKSALNFWFRMKDTEGFFNREEARFDVRSFRDEPPRVVLDAPKTDRDVPAEATVPVRILVDDDFGIHSARLIYKIATGESEPHEEVVLPLMVAEDQSPVPDPAKLEKHRELIHKWELAP